MRTLKKILRNVKNYCNMWLILTLFYIAIGGITFAIVDRFSTKYQQYYTIKRGKQMLLSCFLFWPIIGFAWLIRFILNAFIGLFIFLKMIFD